MEKKHLTNKNNPLNTGLQWKLKQLKNKATLENDLTCSILYKNGKKYKLLAQIIHYAMSRVIMQNKSNELILFTLVQLGGESTFLPESPHMWNHPTSLRKCDSAYQFTTFNL